MYLTIAPRLGQPAPIAPVLDPVRALGQALWQEAPAGVTVAIYFADPEQKRRAIEWAARERAIGPRGTRVVAAELEFGRAIADSGNLVTQLTGLGSVLQTAVSSAPAPAGITPLPGTGPSLIRALALFTHGWNAGISIGGLITTKTVAGVIKQLAPVLTDDVKIMLYGCSSARGLREASDWTQTTTSSGGADSLAAKFRDALVDAGKTRAIVWGHTEVGHTTRNPSLRSFGAGRGKGTDGQSYLGETVFGTLADALLREELAATMSALGFPVPDSRQEAFRAAAERQIRGLRYSCWVGAVIRIRTVGTQKIKETNLSLRGANLPEMVPLYPLEVADLVRRRWSDVCWTPAARERAAMKLAQELRLKRQRQPQTTP